MEKLSSILLQQAIIPDYRMGLFRLLREQWGEDFQIYAGDADFGGSPVSTQEAWQHFAHVQNHYLIGGRFLWQSGCFRQLFSSDVTILNGNMRILSNTVVLFARKVMGRRTILWGHAEGQYGFAALMRGLYLRFCDGFIAYTESQAQHLRGRYPFLKVWVAANACVHAVDCIRVNAALEEIDSILYVGRLVEAKKVRLLLEGFIHARQAGMLHESVRLVFVGDGAERQSLEALALEAGISDRVIFSGHVSDVSKLREYYSRAICSVSPGYVGLSATQSFSFGVPMLIARDEFHSPEIEACKEAFNAEFFDSDNPEALASGLGEFIRKKRQWVLSRPSISNWTSENYSFESMRDAFVEAVARVNKGN